MPHQTQQHPQLSWEFGSRSVSLGWPDQLPMIMGIVNVTPDSFSDGGRFSNPGTAVDHALQMIRDGADVVDIGGESTRPGAQSVSEEEELERVVPVIEGILRRENTTISIDTSKAQVARSAIAAGARIINDVTGMSNPDMIQVAADSDAGLVVMHMLGTPRTMQQDPTYHDVVEEISEYLSKRTGSLHQLGIRRERIVVDPGIGFGKKLKHNLQLIQNLGSIRRAGRPVCLGLSRKSLLKSLLNRPVGDRLAGTLAANLVGVQAGADILRVHDVQQTRDMLITSQAILRTP